MRQRLALTLLLLVAATGGFGQEDREGPVPAVEPEGERIPIVTDEDLKEQRLQQGMAACESEQGKARIICLANLSLQARDARPCELDPSGQCGKVASRAAMADCNVPNLPPAQQGLCQTEVASRYQDPDSCEVAPHARMCLGFVASETRDPSVITERVDDPEERDNMLALYASMSGDESAVDEIADNYKADGARIIARVNEAARTGEPLDNGFCWGLRGGYAENDGYVESDESLQLLCHQAVASVNRLNEALRLADDPGGEARVLEQFKREIQRLEEEADRGEFGSFDDAELEMERQIAEAAGMEAPDPAEVDARVLRRWADERRAACDAAGALEAANGLRDAVARMSESRGQPVREPWLDMNYDAVVAEAKSEEAFDRGLDTARSTLKRVYDVDDPKLASAVLDEAERQAESARVHANPPCDAGHLGELLGEIKLYRRAFAELGEEEGFVDERERRAGAEAGSEWGPGRSVEVEVERETEAEDNACAAPRPDFLAGLRRVEQAAQDRDRDALAAAIAAIPSGCPGDAALLARLADAAVEVAQAGADDKTVGLQRSLADAAGRRQRIRGAWATALTDVAGVVREVEEAERRAADRRAERSSAGGSSGGASSGAGTSGSASADCEVRLGAHAGGLANQRGVEWYVIAQRTDWTVVSVMPAAEGQRPPAGGGATIEGPYPNKAAAERAARAYCRRAPS